MNTLWQMSFTSFDHQPGDWQGSLAIDQADHQRDALMPNFTAIDHKDQFADFCQIRQQLTHKWQVKSLNLNSFILYPATVAFDPTVRFSQIRRFSSNRWQLTTPGLDDASYQGCHCGQPARKVAFRFAWKQLFHGHSNGTIYSTIVHWFTPVLPWLGKNKVYPMRQSSFVKSVR